MFFYVGDIHLEKISGVIHNGLELQFQALAKIFRLAKSSGASHVVFGGDIFDTPRPKQSTVVSFLNIVRQSGIPCSAILGNHDFGSAFEHSLEMAKFAQDWVNITVYTEPTVAKIDGQKIWMCPHPYIEEPPRGVELCVGHFPWKNARADNGYIHKTGACPRTGYWLMSDFHEPQHGKRYVYAGSITQLTFGETPGKGYLRIEGKDVQFVRLKPNYIMEQSTVSDEKELRALAGKKRDGVPVYYSVDFSDGFIPAAGWQRKYPHIIPRRYSGKKKDAEASTAAARFILSTNPLDGLPDWLASKDGLTKAGRKWALSKAKAYEAKARA